MVQYAYATLGCKSKVMVANLLRDLCAVPGKLGWMHCHCKERDSLQCKSRMHVILQSVTYCKKTKFLQIQIPRVVPFTYCCTRFKYSVMLLGDEKYCVIESKKSASDEIASIVSSFVDGDVLHATFRQPWLSSMVIFRIAICERSIIWKLHGEINMKMSDMSERVCGFHLADGTSHNKVSTLSHRDAGKFCSVLFPLHSGNRQEREMVRQSRQRAVGGNDPIMNRFKTGLRESYTPRCQSDADDRPKPEFIESTGKWRCYWSRKHCSCSKACACVVQWNHVDLTTTSIRRYLSGEIVKPQSLSGYIQCFLHFCK